MSISISRSFSSAGGAPLASPAFTGTPTVPTAAVDTNTTQAASTAYVIGQEYAKLAGPTFTGAPTLPTGTVATTQTQADNSTKLATTAYADTLGATKGTLTAWTDYSPTITGYTATVPTNTVYRYMQIGKMVILTIRELTAGVSNSVNTTYTLPVSPAATKTNMFWHAPAAVVDNTTTVTSGIGLIVSAGTTVSFGLGPYATVNVLGGGFTASNNKKITYCTILYEVP